MAQCNNPNGPDFPSPPGTTSCDAVSFCNGEINGYCGQLGAANVTWPFQLCNGNGVPNNMEWLAFVAAYNTITMDITSFNCPGVPGGFQGIQAGIYDDCETAPGNLVPGACQTNCTNGTITLTSSSFIIGNVYYLFIDGCAGDMCEYTISVTPDDATALPDLVNPPGISGPTDMCAGAQGIVYSIPEVFAAIDYIWTVPAGWTVNQNSPGNTVTIDFPNGTTSGQICVVAENDCHDTDPVCITVNLSPIPLTTDYGYYCQGETFVYDGDGLNYTEGNYVIDFFGGSFYGCDSTVNLIVIENPDVYFDIEVAICQNESYDVCGIPYDIPGGFDIDCGPNFQGCDSTISLTMVVLEPLSVIEPPGILGCGANVSIFLDGFSSFGDSFLWTTVDGDICDAPDQQFIQVCLPGTYCLTSTMEYTTITQGTVTCTHEECVVVTSNSEEPMTSVMTTDIACNGETNGTATITVSNMGIGPFTYDWLPNVSVSNSASGLSGGTYTVTVTADGNGCTSVETIIINEPPVISLSTTQNDIACNGGSTGTATVNPSGGTPGYTYSWCNGQTTATATGLATGQCCVTVTDASSCTQEICVTIAEPAPLTASSTQVNVDCNGTSSGSGTVTAGGGTPGYTYLWCDGQTTATATGLPAGQCCVVVSDANSCTVQSCVDLTEPAGMSLSTTQTEVSCNGGTDGTATVTPTGGAGGYTYLWCNNQVSQTATGLSATACDVVVTDANGCTALATVTPTQPTAISLTTSQTEVNCINGTDGTATVNPTGGSGSYTYVWCDGQTTQTATGLPAGPCNVVVTDMNSCTEQVSVTLTEPGTAISISGTSTEASCGNNNGTISIDVAGGTPGYTYLWSPLGGTVEDPGSLGPGTYTVVVTDLNNCTQTFSIDVSTPSGLGLSNTATDASCNGGADGSIDLVVSGGQAPITFQWDNGAGTVEDPSGLDAGTYNVTVTDGAGCTFVSSAIIDEPEAITASGSSTLSTCGDDNGSISITVAGGTGPFSYLWSPGGATDQNPTGLGPNSYSVVITDANDCTGTTDVEVMATPVMQLTITPTDALCNGEADGSIDLEVTGGAGGYSYDWSGTSSNSEDPIGLGAGNYEVTVTDADDCTMVIATVIGEPTAIDVSFTTTDATCGEDNGGASITVNGGTGPYEYAWNNGAGTDPDPNDLEPISYEVTITDDNGCTMIETIDIGEVTPMSLDISAIDASCNGGADGTIDLEVSDGAGPFTYVWTNTISTDQDPTGLSANNYEVLVTDADGCTATIDIDIDEPGLIDINGSSQDATCGNDNGAISLNVNGGAGGYTYLWSPNGSTDEDPTGLSPGTYSVVVTDMNDCTVEYTIDVETPTGLGLQATSLETTCNGGTNGSIDLTINGGTDPFEYIWDNGETTEDISDLAAGTYCVTVTDDTDCTIVLCETVAEPTPISIDGNSTLTSCNGGADGTIATSVTGGTGPYTYLWTPGNSTDPNPTGLAANDYIFEVTDVNGCIETYAITVGEPTVLESSAVGVDVSCAGGNDGFVDITAMGGTVPYTYAWNNGSTLEDPNDFAAGGVTGTVTDANGCTSEVSLILNEPMLLEVSGTSTDETCGEANGTISLTVLGGVGPYNYIWTPALPDTATPTDLTIGNYCADVVDANGCVMNFCIDVTTPNALSLDAVVQDADCNGAGTGSIDLTVMGGVPPFTQVWSNGWTGEDLADVPAGSYDVVVTDATDCTITLTEVVSEPSLIQIDGTSTDALCGANDGTIDINVSGGTGTYTYLWSPGGSTSEDPTGLGIGSYTVVVTDVNSCTQTFEIEVQTPNGLSLTPTATDASCNGGADGNVTTLISGGTPNFTYLWGDGSTDPDLLGVPAGTYDVTVTDADGCEVVSSAIVNQPDAIAISGNPTDETCNSSNGTITTSVNGGTGTYSYMWAPSGSTDANPTGLQAVDHTVVVTDANGCTGTATFTVDAPNAIEGTLTPQDISCDGGNDGQIEAVINGGTAPYTYDWSPMGGTDAIAAGLPVGTYTVVVTDADDCTFTLTETLAAPAPISITGVSQDATCGEANGSIDLTVGGGTAGYTYEWLPALPGTEDPTNVSAGTYTVVVTDINGCSDTYDITVNTPNMLTAGATSTDASCNGGADGTANVVPGGGVGPYDYLWMPGGATVANPNDLAAGSYTVIVTDATDCTVSVSVQIDEPIALSVTHTSTPALCGDDNGSADLTVYGGTAPYQFIWSTGSTDEDPTDFGAGIFNVTVTDANDCTTTYDVEIDAPGAPSVSLDPTDALCNGDTNGGIDVTVVGGTSPFIFNWSNGETTEDLSGIPAGTYDLTIVDGLGCDLEYLGIVIDEPAELSANILGPSAVACNGGSDASVNLDVMGGTQPYDFDWDNGAPDVQNPSGLQAGDYNVVVTDANGCTAVESITVSEPAALQLSAIPSSTNCNGSADGSIDLTVTGGVGVYTFTWSNASVDEDPTGLTSGDYVVVVTDDNGCTESLPVFVDEPTPVAVDVTDMSNYGIYNLSCDNAEDGSATVVATGGQAPFTFLWDDGTTGAELSEVGQGTYEVTATDANGCTGVTNLTLDAPSAVSAFAQIIEVSCYGDDDGAIIVDSIGGGTGPYMFAIDGGDFSPSNLFASLVGGSYELTVQDMNGCETTQTIIVNEPEELNVIIVGDLDLQLGDSTNLEAIVTTDTSNLQQWGWTQGIDFRDTCSLCLERWVYPFNTGTYEFIAIDENGCIDIEEVMITVRKDRPVYIPNAFSPNGDGVNDFFQIYLGAGASNVKTFMVFNRWGEVVYELSNFFLMAPEDGWDGRFKGELMNPAVFVFYAEVEFLDGHVEVYKGDVSIVKQNKANRDYVQRFCIGNIQGILT